jgi:two-component system LytT family response regulator
MNVLILEDEKPAWEKLQKTLASLDPDIRVMAVLSSVRETVRWLEEKGFPDLIFMDIELSDGASFQLFTEMEVRCPIIFTTAYDEYWQEAFEHNGIDYLLKPVKEEKLKAALHKMAKLKEYFSANYKKLSEWDQPAREGKYKKRFLVKKGTDYVSIKTEDIAYFYAAHKLVCLVSTEARKFLLDQSLSDIEKQTDPSLFHRVNRKYLVNMNAIRRIRSHAKGKLILEIEPRVEEEVVVSQEAAAHFKKWLEQ